VKIGIGFTFHDQYIKVRDVICAAMEKTNYDLRRKVSLAKK
jgi:hypothetical protein